MRKIEAVERMVNQEFNAIPLTLIEKAYPEIDGWENITPLKSGDVVEYLGDYYELITVLEENEIVIEDAEGNKKTVDIAEIYKDDEIIFPMWSTVWQTVGFQSEWIGRNLDKVANCGFEIYEAEDLDGYIIGVNGAGYDFYEAHWVPLYEAQGLKWHNED